MSQSTSPWRKPGARRIIAVAGVSAVVLAAAIGPSSASGSTSVSVTATTSVNGVVGAPAFTGEAGTVGITLTNQSLKNLAGYALVVPKGIGTVSNLGVSNANWNQTKVSCGFLSNCSALYLVTPKALSYVLSTGKSITSSFGVTAPAAGTAQFRVLGVGSNYSGLVVVGSQPTLTIVDGAATALRVSVTPPVVKGQPNNVTVKSVREYPAGTFTAKKFPGPLTPHGRRRRHPYDYTAPDVTGRVQVTFPVTFRASRSRRSRRSPRPRGSISGSTSFDVVAAGCLGQRNGHQADRCRRYDVHRRAPQRVQRSTSRSPRSPATRSPATPTATPRSTWPATSRTTTASRCTPTTTRPASTGPARPRSARRPETGLRQLRPGPGARLRELPHRGLAARRRRVHAVRGRRAVQPDRRRPGADVVTGKITDAGTPRRQGFCVDVYAISRADDSFTGDLTIPVLFVEDPKLRGI